MKTKYGFDLDGTLTQPAIRQLANDLYEAGYEIYVITGGLADVGEWTMEERIKRLALLGVKYTEIIRCIDPDITQLGRIKGEKCNELGISLIIDDSDLYLEGITTVSTVQRLKVL